MLTVEMLQQNTALAGLTEAQLNAIAEMSRNDENTVIGTKIGALHGQYDTDIFGITGVAKNQGEKSYDYAKRVLTEYKNQITSSATVAAQLANAKKEVETLKQKIAEGNVDETVKQQLKDSKALVAQLQQQLTEQTNAVATQKEKYEAQIKGIYVDSAFNEALSGLKFKAGIADSVRDILVKAAKAEVLAKGTPDFVEQNGTKVLVFRDKDGNLLNNPANNLNPFTASELLMQTALKDVIDTGRQQGGGGTGGNGGGNGGGGATLDLSGARTQVEADEIISNHLLSLGLTRDSVEFSQKSMSLRQENNVAQLPIR